MSHASSATVLCSLAVCVNAAVAQPAPIERSDPGMNRAISRAQASLDDFLRLKETPPAGVSQFTVKVRFVEGSTVEHMWVRPFRLTQDRGFEGILQNSPRFLLLRQGQQVSFDRGQISDWGYTKDGKLYGYRTICELFNRDPGFRERVRAEGSVHECVP